MIIMAQETLENRNKTAAAFWKALVQISYANHAKFILFALQIITMRKDILTFDKKHSLI